VSGTDWTAERVLAEPAPGIRMRSLFDTVKAATAIAPDELAILLPSRPMKPAWRRSAPGLPGPQAAGRPRASRHLPAPLRSHRRLGHGRPRRTPGHRRHPDRRPLRAAARARGIPRPAPSADGDDCPLWFVKHGNHADVQAGITVVQALRADPDPLVHKPVGIYLAHAGDRLPHLLTELLDKHGKAIPRAAYRIAVRERRLPGAD